MKVAVIGSRNIVSYPLAEIIPADTTEIISGGARRADTVTRVYAQQHGILLTEIHPDYARYGKGAPLRRNTEIVARADLVIALWDGKSTGTAHSISLCRSTGKPVVVVSVT